MHITTYKRVAGQFYKVQETRNYDNIFIVCTAGNIYIYIYKYIYIYILGGIDSGKSNSTCSGSLEVAESSSYIFTITPESKLGITGDLLITFPNEFNIPSSGLTASLGTVSKEGSPPNTIKVSGGMQSGYTVGGSAISVTVSGIGNPEATYTKTYTFTVETKLSGYRAHLGTFELKSTTYTTGKLTAISITVSDLTNLKQAHYTFKMANERPIPSNSGLMITFPDDYSDAQIAGLQCGTYLCTVNSKVVMVTDLFPTRILAGQDLEVIIQTIFNPRATNIITGDFTFLTYTANTNQKSNTGISNGVTMTLVNNFLTFNIALQSYKNLETTKYTFTLMAGSPILEDDEIHIESPISCTYTFANESDNLNIKSQSSQYFVVGSEIGKNQNFRFSISCNNPMTTEATSDFKVEARQTCLTNCGVYKGTTTIQTTTGSPFTSISITNSNQEPENFVEVTFFVERASVFQFNTLKLNPNPNVNIPEPSNFDNKNCEILNNLGGVITCTKEGNYVVLSNIASVGTPFQFKLKNLRNPKMKDASGSFQLKSYDNEYIVEEGTSDVINVDCDTPCKTCTVDDQTYCNSCYPPNPNPDLQITDKVYYHTVDHKCLDDCPPKFIKDDDDMSCKLCKDPCDSCAVLDTNCTSCLHDKYLQDNECGDECKPAHFDLSKICYPCAGNCKECQGSAIFCTSCQSTGAKYFYEAEHKCYTICPPGTFPDNVNTKCVPCSTADNCKECIVQADRCTKCLTSFLYIGDLNQCHQNCDSVAKYPINNGSDCIACGSSCPEGKCVDTVSKCTECEGKLYLTDSSTCETVCPNTFYPNTTTNKCDKCSGNCLTCDKESTNCTTCNTDNYLKTDGNICVTAASCPSNYLKDSSTSLWTCTPCHTSCKTCVTTTTTCESCDPLEENYAILYGTNCIKNCPAHTYNDTSNNKCVDCDENCSECDVTPEKCTECYQGTFLNATTCNTSCPIGNYGNTQTKKCESCVDCAECDGSPTTCTKCPGTKVLYQSKCEEKCPDNTVKVEDANQDWCKDCPANCKLCTTSGVCTECISMPIIYNGQCYTECPSGKYRSGDTCIAPCTPGTFGNPSTRNCEPCVGCKECDGTATTCTKCQQGLIPHQAKCIGECPTGTMEKPNSSGCATCAGGCEICSVLITNCTKCEPQLYFVDNSCLGGCPSGYTSNKDTLTCSLIPVTKPTEEEEEESESETAVPTSIYIYIYIYIEIYK